MKLIIEVICLIFAVSAQAQIVYTENFDSLATGLDLTTAGFELAQGSSYTGTVTADVAAEGNNKFARVVAKPSGSANFQFSRWVEVEPGSVYTFENVSRGPFKRQLRVYDSNENMLAANQDYKPGTAEEETAWKKLGITFFAGPGVNRVKITFHHYWSGTIDIDSIRVSRTGGPGMQTSYYLSSSEGSDANPGTKNAPWKTLDKISSAFLLPGDSVLFKCGDRFNGHFVVNGSGNAEKPVLITSYGSGEKPMLTGQVGEAGGGDYQEAVLVENHDHLIFDGLEIQNERTVSRPGVADTDAYGMYIVNSGDKVMHNFMFRNMTFRNVFAVQPILDPEDFNSIQVSELSFYSSKNTEAGKEKNIDKVEIEGSYFGNSQRFGILFKHSGGLSGIGNDSINRNMNIHIHNNEFYYNGGTGVLPNSTYNCLIEENIFDHPGASTDPRMPGRGSSIWNYNAMNTIMQYNMCLSTRGYLDSHGIHIDNKNINTFVQYNYMEDCEGGFVEILMDNVNAVYRFNVSVNDGWRVNEKWKDSNHTIWVNSDRWSGNEDFRFSDSIYIYNNTCIIDRPYTTSINMDGKNMFVYNNIWSSTKGAGLGVQNMKVRANGTPFFMSNNLFEGTVSADFVDLDAHPQKGSPLFNDTGEKQYAYQLQAGSPAINNGTPLPGPKVKNAGYGVFKNIPVYPNVDLFGNPVDLTSGTPNIGACNAKNGEIVTGTGERILPGKESGWLIYPDSNANRIHLKTKLDLPSELTITLVNLRGQLVQQNRKEVFASEKEFDLPLQPGLRNGIYVLNIQGEGVFHSRKMVLYRK